MLHKLFIPIFRYNNKRVAILGNIRRKIKKQYHFMQESTDKFKNEELILRDYLAIERTKLANVRTLFSYIRTSSIFLLPESEYFRSKVYPVWTVSHGYVSQPELSCSFWASSVIFKWVNN